VLFGDISSAPGLTSADIARCVISPSASLATVYDHGAPWISSSRSRIW
jgi:hypothetical protein